MDVSVQKKQVEYMELDSLVDNFGGSPLEKANFVDSVPSLVSLDSVELFEDVEELKGVVAMVGKLVNYKKMRLYIVSGTLIKENRKIYSLLT